MQTDNPMISDLVKLVNSAAARRTRQNRTIVTSTAMSIATSKYSAAVIRCAPKNSGDHARLSASWTRKARIAMPRPEAPRAVTIVVSATPIIT